MTAFTGTSHNESSLLLISMCGGWISAHLWFKPKRGRKGILQAPCTTSLYSLRLIYSNLTDTNKIQVENMRNLVASGLVLFVLALNYGAFAQVDLSGTQGQTILNEMTGSAQTANISTNTSLWNWGDNPMGYTLNQSGQLMPTQDVLVNDFGGWVPSI